MRDRGPGPAARDRARPPEERSLTAVEPRFVGSFPSADVPLDPPLPEIALLGRSNVGKSSLLNALAGRRIARVAHSPGKTRALNVYHMGDFYFLDLPGYGYAKAGKAQRREFGALIGGTLDRAHLAGVLWLLDVRRDPSSDDRAIQDLFATKGTRVLAAVTDGDKLPRGPRAGRERELRETLELDTDQLIMTSARAREGIAELQEAVAALVRDAVV